MLRHRFAPDRHAALWAAWPAALAFALPPCGGATAEEPRHPATPEDIVAYRESGAWDRDTTAVVDRARRALARQLNAGVRRRPAIVLDIDDTALSTYDCLKAAGFVRRRASCAASADLPAIPQTVQLFRYARSRGVAVFFVTGRRERLRRPTKANLRRGFRGYERLLMRPDRERPGTHDGFKARARRAITRRGYRILVNVGDQASDLDGGHAVRRFKVPNPMYVIPEA